MSRTLRQDEDILPEVHEPSVEMVTVKPGTLNIIHYVYQHGGHGHYNSIMDTVVKHTLDS